MICDECKSTTPTNITEFMFHYKVFHPNRSEIIFRKMFLKELKINRKIILNNKDSPKKFIYSLKKNPLLNPTTHTPIKFISGRELYVEYRLWCSQNKVDACSNTKFGTKIKNIIIKKRLKQGVVYEL